MRIFRVLFYLFFLFNAGHALGQNPIGLPNIISYSRDFYNAGLQNRGIVQDKSGILYFANSEGLLSFDGTYWKLYALPNKTTVRAVAVGNDNKIYVGGQNELGYFSPDKSGKLIYKSLAKQLPEKNTSFKDVWDIIPYGDRVFFRSQSNIFQLDNKSINSYPAVSQWLFLGLSHGRLIAQDAKKGLFEYGNGEWSPLKTEGILAVNSPLTGLQQLGKDSILLTTLKQGLYVLYKKQLSKFKFAQNSPFINQQIMCALALGQNRIAIGTHMGGCYIITRKGEIIQNISRKEGLQNNTVLGLFLDRDQNLWMGLDDGIDFVAYNSAIKHIYPERLNEGAGYSAMMFDHYLYIGTSNSLYKIAAGNVKDLSTINGEFESVKGTKGSAWGLFNINNSLLFAHHEGAFQIKGGEIYPINIRTGYWNFSSYDHVLPSSTIIAGNYNGLDLIRYNNGKFTSQGNISFNESSRYVIINNHTGWVAHAYKGIYKIDFASPIDIKSKLYNNKDGLPSSLKNRIFKVKNRMVVTTEKGIYEFNAATDKFEYSAYFKDIFGTKDICYLKEDAEGNIWFIESKKLGVVDFSGQKPSLIYFPEISGKLVSDFENIYTLNSSNIFVGAEKGFYHINYERYKKNRNNIHVLIRMIKTFGETDSLLNGGYVYSHVPTAQLPTLTDKQNSLHIEYSAPNYQQQGNIQYSYFLKGFDKGWSAWSKKTERDYTNLSEGNYTFQVRARGNLGNESLITSYSFIVLPPWYRTIWAYMVYGICFVIFNYVIFLRLKKKFRQQRERYEKEQKRLNYLHQLEMEKSENQIIALKNEKLLSEIEGKNSELASIGMHLLQKGELLAKIREELVRLKKATQEEMQSEDLKKLIRILNQESKMDKDWEQFAYHFDNTHSDFLKAIKEVHPDLNMHELKLCAYLRMNLSSKEMAQLMNISVRGVEISRYRLRKKLHIPTEVTLYGYFTEFALEKKEVV
jgi:ligand-binding sensor domain-containing protein/DNA-binding CsgD family transcriptional regulator